MVFYNCCDVYYYVLRDLIEIRKCISVFVLCISVLIFLLKN